MCLLEENLLSCGRAALWQQGPFIPCADVHAEGLAASSQAVTYLYPSLWIEIPAGQHLPGIEFDCMKTFAEEHVGLMTSWIFCSWLGDFWRLLSANRAHSHPQPHAVFYQRRRGLGAYTKALTMLLHPLSSVLCRDRAEQDSQCIPGKLYQLLSISCLQTGSVGMLALYGQSLLWRYSTICVSVGWHHLCTINIAVG